MEKIIPTPKELKEMKLREMLRQLDEISDYGEEDCGRIEDDLKTRNIFK